MSLLPDSATFHERVQDCFVAYRGRGVSLSASDLELLDAWAAAEVPFEVVARGIRKAAEAALWDGVEGETRLRSLRACRRQVETELKRYLARSAGAHTEGAPSEPFHVTRHKKLVAAIKKATKPQVPRWVDALPTPDGYAAAEREETLALALLVRALPFERRASLLREARRMMENAEAMSAAAQRESYRFHRAALVRQAWAIPSLW